MNWVYGPILRALRGPTCQALLGLVSCCFDVVPVAFVTNHPFKILLCWQRGRQEDVWVIYLHLLRYNLIEEIQPKV